ncbi:hypothetical protein [Cellulophaga sp. Hel_I_12]|uniref:hypothetical protein n=1 Tax=Cellulophaga sp. Hel_I_12 TaxID=1249972 RepID=UPI000647D1AF|nr:hypothetical protein [Cellulophaga sp. Hel_I_12]
MKISTLFLVFLFGCLSITAQSIIGAWEHDYASENGDALKTTIIFSDGHQVSTTYDAKTGEFINTTGGSYALSGDTLNELIEFDTENAERVGTEVAHKVALNDKMMTFTGTGEQFTRIDDGSPGKLQGAWLMSGRVVDGKKQQRATDGPRKTMKILSGTRFQWIAYNTETKQFMGTGGGTYTTIDGVYVENIGFFSRDNSRVGASLDFKFELKDGDWHHSGLSSKGDPINEIWSLRAD